jgi:predicted porin
MKKSLIALAALGAFAGAASAQSSVTMFGVVDLNVQTVSNAERTYSMGTDGMASSRLGFRGTEDLGGGLKAGFWLEMGIAPDTGRNAGLLGNGTGTTPVDCTPGSGQSTLPQANNAPCGASGSRNITTNENTLFFNRRSTVSLSNQWGELRLGRDYTATFWNWTVFDPFGTNGVGAATNLALGADLQAALAGTTYGTLVRANNMVQYILPNGVFGPGLYGQLQISAGEGSNGNKYYGGRIGYAAGAFDIAGSYGLTDCLDTACTIDMNVWNLGGSWNFGFMKLSGFYGSMEGSGPVNKATRENWYVGVSAPFGQWNFKASYGGTNGKDLLNGVDASQWAIGADYNLSKRTALYATWSSINNDAGARFSVNPAQSVVPIAGSFNSTGGQIGVRHTF